MKKRHFAAAFTLAAGVAVCTLAGCFQTTVSVTSIEKSNTVGLVDYYTVTYSDGTTSQFSVKNGENGSDAAPVTVDDIYAKYREIYGDELTYAQFVEKYLAGAGEDVVHTALNNALRSCVTVYSVFDYRETRYSPVKKVYSGGSGVVYKMDEEYTYIVTNYHVVYENDAYGDTKISKEIHAYLYGSESYPEANLTQTAYTYDNYAIECEYIGGAITYDVAVIRAKTEDVLAINPDVVPVELEMQYSVGDSTYAIGNPELLGISVTEGIVSVESEYIELKLDATTRSYRSIRTDTAITHGSSGGGLFNAGGKLIGLNNAGDDDVSFINFAIPAEPLKNIADGIIHYNAGEEVKYTKKTVIGVRSYLQNSRYVFDAATGKGYIKEDIWVTEVSEGGLAEQAGLLADDYITSVTINGVKREITRQFQISDMLLGVREGDKIKIGYLRGEDKTAGETQEVTVTSANLERVE